MFKKGYIRTLEAVIAIVIILLFIFTITPERVTNPKAVPPQVENAQRYILDEVENNQDLRDEALAVASDGQCGGDAAVAPNIDLLVSNNLPPGFAYSCAVCSTTSCVFTPEGVTTSVYVDDVMITPDNIADGPKIVRIWFWQLS